MKKMNRPLVTSWSSVKRSLGFRGQRGRQLVPTFKEFVSYLLDEARAGHELDMHWTPVYSFCTPCQVNLTHIVKFETLERDSNAIIRALGIQRHLPEKKLVHANSSSGKLKGKQDKSLGQYLKELDPNQLQELIKLYQPDFDMFGYSPNSHK